MSSIYFLIEKNIFNPDNTVGIIGYGNVGKQLKKALDYFSIKNFVYDPFLNFDFLSNLGLIKNCDLISLHVPLTNRTEFPTCNMIDKSFLEDVEGKTLVNTSRGGVVNESNLLNSNNINYVSDVWMDEPSPSKDIVDFALLATPHIAGHSINGKMNGTIMLINFLQRYIGLEERLKISNLEIIKQFISSSSYLEIEADHEIKKYKTEYDIQKESDNFKRLYLNSERNFQKNIFSEVRSNHLIRLDIKT
jgi:erythronate-4-phosphate dehydrogenase